MCSSKLLNDCKLMPDGPIESQAQDPSLCYQQLKAGQSSIFWARDKNCWLQRNETWDCDERPMMPLLHQVFVTLTMILLGQILTSPSLPCSLSPLLNGNNIMSLVLLSCDKWSSRNLAVNEMEVINLKMIGIMILRCEWASLQGRARQLINHNGSWIK